MLHYGVHTRGAPRTSKTSKMEFFAARVNSYQPLTNVTENSILDILRVLGAALQYCVYL